MQNIYGAGGSLRKPIKSTHSVFRVCFRSCFFKKGQTKKPASLRLRLQLEQYFRNFPFYFKKLFSGNN
nr:MAG TPA: hypothetical protein [Caudoviricetes sp.]